MATKGERAETLGRGFAGTIGVIVMIVLEETGVIDLSGLGAEGAIPSVIYTGLGGACGGLIVYEIIRRIRERI